MNDRTNPSNGNSGSDSSSASASHNGGNNGNGPTLNERTVNQVRNMVMNAFLTRSDLLKQLLDPRRDIDKDCGYPDSARGYIKQEEYQVLYEREAIAARVVEVYPKECWQVTPTVYEDEDPETVTDFEEAWDDIGQQLGGEESYFSGENSSRVWEYLKRVDELSGIGQFGVILLGIDDGLAPELPANGVDTHDSVGLGTDAQYWDWRNRPSTNCAVDSPPTPLYPNLAATVNKVGTNKNPHIANLAIVPTPNPYFNPRDPNSGMGSSQSEVGQGNTPSESTLPKTGDPSNPDKKDTSKKATRKLLFLRVFPESQVQITQYETNIFNPRYGKPVSYLITLYDERNSMQAGIGVQMSSINVHWTRVVHVSDLWHQSCSSEVLAIPRMRPVLNRLLDLRKLYGGSAEMYWKGALPGIVFETHPNIDLDQEIDVETTKDQLENFMNTLQRYLLGVGGTWKMLAPAVVDPKSQIEVQIQAICIKLGIPIRVFMGSERGELASSQDDDAWNDRLLERMTNYITPRIIVPFVDRLIYLGVLPVPNVKTARDVIANAKKHGKKLRRDKATGRIFILNEKGSPVGEVGRGGYKVEWPDITSMSEMDKTRISLRKTQAITSFIAGNGEMILAMPDFWTRIMGFTEEEAKTIIENAEKALEEKMEEQQRQMEEMDIFGDGMDEFGNPIDPAQMQGGMPGQGGVGGGNNPFAKGGTGAKKPKGISRDAGDSEAGEGDYERNMEGEQSLNPTDDCVYAPGTNICVNCGGEGSGKPGPCPTGVKEKPKVGRSGKSELPTKQTAQKVQAPTPSSTSKGEKGKGKEIIPEKVPSEKAARAKAAHKMVDKQIQRYAEEQNEPRFAKVMEGSSLPDSEPVDVVAKNGDGVELKTMVDNDNDKLTMDTYAQVRKILWEQENGTTFHTVVSDDRAVYNAKGEGKHDETKRVYYYRRGVAGSARIGNLHQVHTEEELKKLMAMPEEQLPKAAQRTDGKHREGKWQEFKDEKGKGFRNSVTGREVRAKK